MKDSVVVAVGVMRRTLRCLETGEHRDTRPVWEQIFTEDTGKFLDYYYEYIAKKNTIYVVEEIQEDMTKNIFSMIHLNPYYICFNQKCYITHYIVAVATLEQYRKQGLMRQVLEKSLRDLYEQKEVFAYLMPEAEAIYTPYNFVTVYEQTHYLFEMESEFLRFLNGKLDQISGKKEVCIRARYAKKCDSKQLSLFATAQLEKKYHCYTEHDEEYFGCLIEEQKSQNGGIVILERQTTHDIVGYFYVAKEEAVTYRKEWIREMIIDSKEGVLCALFQNFVCEHKLVPQEQTKIMIRPIDVLKYLNVFIEDKKIGDTMSIRDDILVGNTGTYIVEREDGRLEFRKKGNHIIEDQTYSIEQLVHDTMSNKLLLFNEIV